MANRGLGDEMESLLIGVHVGVREPSGAGVRGPVPPVATEANLRTPVAGVAEQFGVQRGTVGVGEGGDRRPHLLVGPAHVQRRGVANGPRGRPEIEHELRPEEPAHG